MDPLKIGQKIRQLRKQNNLTVEELAKKIGVTKGFISRIENNSSQPSFNTLIKISNELRIPTSVLLDEESSIKSYTITRVNERIKSVYHNKEREYVQWSLFSKMSNRKMEPQIVEIPFKDSSIYSTTQETFFYVLKGSIKNNNGEIMNEGDCAYLSPNVEYSAISISQEKALVLFIINTA